MFDHMMKVNDLERAFKKYELDVKKDVTFIKELICGPAKDSAEVCVHVCFDK